MATLKDIAQQSGISTAAVSRILNNDEKLSVNPATREKVLRIAAELNYEPKAARLSPLTIGIFQWCDRMQEMEDPYYQSIRLGVEKYCLTHQCTVVRAYQSDPDYLTTLKNVQGLICIGKFNAERIELLKSLAPYVIFVDMRTKQIHCTTISMDFYEAVMDMMDYLTGRGHRDIVFFAGVERLSDGSVYPDERKQAYLDYCREHGLGCRVYEGDYSSIGGFQMARKLLEDTKSRQAALPDAVFAASDALALGAMRAFYEEGLKIPEDISIVGCDDSEVSAYSQPPLTTIHVPAHRMGSLAAHVVCDQKRSGLTEDFPIRLTLPCSLQIRSSCK